MKYLALPVLLRDFLLLWLFVLGLLPFSDGAITDITDSVMHGVNGGIMAAFGDYTDDKFTDIFVLSDNKRDLDLIMARRGSYERRNLVKSTAQDEGLMSSVMPGDFNGDTNMDVLVTRKVSGSDGVIVQIYWTIMTDNHEYRVNSSTVLHDKLLDQPLLMDYNGDMIPDLYAQSLEDKKRYFWVFGTDGNFTKVEQKLPSKIQSFSIRSPNSNAFVDLDKDFTPDLFVTAVDSSGQNQFEIWMSEFDGLTFNKTVGMPQNSGKVVGQSTFVDINGDSVIDILLPVCNDATCQDSSIYAYVNNKWSLLTDSFAHHGVGWGFAPPGEGENLPITLRVGDMDLDGFPDVLAILKSFNDKEQNQKAFVLLNTVCKAPSCQSVGRTLEVQFSTPLQEVNHVTAATFYDLNGNGIVDLLVQYWDGGKPKILAFQNGFHQDACFISVMVISGRCNSDCPNGKPAYSTNQPGIAVGYRTTGPSGGTLTSIAGQLSQSAHFALQLPYTVFGLGLTPNFVDQLDVGIPRGIKEKQKTRKWTNIIPNAQMVIIPHPPPDPPSWVNKLFLSPFANNQVIYTAAALLGTLVFVAGIVGALQWKERLEDKREKLQESQKFHFDAM